jgi:hypothetical protein
MKLICELMEDVEMLVEKDESTNQKNYYIKGIFLQAEQKNRNGRVYPLETMEKEVNRYSKQYIDTNRAFGELGHPDGPTINLERVSHMVKELKQEGANFIGKAKIMETPYGKIVKNLIDEGAKLGVSSRGMGSLKTLGGSQIVQNDFHLATAGDIVADPSAPMAFVEGIMEGREWIWNNGILKEADVQEIKDVIVKEFIKVKPDESALASSFERFMSRL